MKKLLILLFSILISFNSYGETICIDTDAQERDGIIYLSNEIKPFTGKNLCKYENSQIESEGNYKDGKEDGKWTWWYENGQIQLEVTFKDGKWTWWYENGQIQLEVTFKDGKEDGKWTWWYENGHKQLETNYIDGKLDGKWTWWYENGQIWWEINYKDGECISGDCPD